MLEKIVKTSRQVVSILVPHSGIIFITIFVVIANILSVNIDKSYADSESLNYTNLDASQISKAIDAIDQYTPSIEENSQDVELNIMLAQSDGFVNKNLSDSSVITEIAKKDFEYTIQPGETITTIANKFDIHVASIIDKNGLSVDQLEKLKAGQKLTIPVKDTSDSKDWLVQLNQKKEEVRQLALKQQAEQQAKARKLALARGTVTRDSSSSRNNSAAQAKISTGAGSKNNGYPYGYCTYYVATQRSVPGHLGNAGQWIGNARSAGFSTGSTPVPGAIVVTNESWVGHVAYVESVNGDSFTVSEMNYKGWGIVSSRTIDANSSVIKGFIY